MSTDDQDRPNTVTVVQDITECKQIEESLKESEERFRATFEQAAVGIAHVSLDGRWLRVNDRLCEIVGYNREELLELAFQDITHADDLQKDLQQAQRLLAGEIQTYSMQKRYIKKDGSVVWINLTVSLVKATSGEPNYFIAVIEDIDGRKRAQEEIRTRSRQQSAVAELGMRALTEKNLQAFMERSVTHVARTLEVEYCKVLELMPGEEKLVLLVGVGWKEGLVGNATVDAGLDSQAGYTLLSNEPVIVEDLDTEGRFSGPPLLREHGVKSGISVIIGGREKPFGVLGAHTGIRRQFSEDDANFLQAVANVLAVAVERRRAEEKVIEVREAERERIARDLHDEVLQDLTYALTATQLLQSTPATEVEDRLERVTEALQRAGEGVYSAIHDLRLERKQNQSFAELLDSLVKLNRQRSPESCIELSVGAGLPPLSNTTKVELARIAGEALSNVRRHSGAHRVWVGVGSSEGRLWFEIEDDGQGFDPATVVGGVGINGMRERAWALGGSLEVTSAPGRGAKVRFELDLGNKSEEESEGRTRLLLVEDHASFREALASIFERETGFDVVGQAGSLSEAVEMLDGVDVAVVDLGLPDGFGGDLIKTLRANNPQAQVLVLTATFDQMELARAVESGAAGVLHKSTGMEQLLEAVRRLNRGERLMPLEEVVELLRFVGTCREQEYETRQTLEQLTDREKEVLRALAEGLDSPQIAQRLNISVKTERNHMANILAKLGMHSRLQVLVFALRYGLVEIR